MTAPIIEQGTQAPDEQPTQPTVEVALNDTSDLSSLPEGVQKYIKSLRAESQSRRLALEELNEKLSKAKTPEEFEAATKDSNAKVTDLQAQVAALANGLPLESASRLRGATPEELDADAKTLKTLLGVGQAPTPSTEGTAKATPPVIPNPTGSDLSGGLNPTPTSSTEKYDPAKLAEVAMKASGPFVR